MPIDVDSELRQVVEPALCRPPVEAVAPVFGDVPQNLARHAVFPRAFADLIRPSGKVKTTIEIRNGRICNANGKRRDFHDYSQQKIAVAATCATLSREGR